MSEGYDGLPAYYSQSSDPLTPHVGFSLKGMDPIIAENFVLADTAISGGGGSTVKVNGSTINNPNFNGTTPAAPGGSTNVTWQFDGSGNVSAYVTSGGGGTPSLPFNSIQFNKAGAFGGLASFVINPANGEVSITDTAASSTGLAALSVFGNAHNDNIQNWYEDGSSAGSPDFYLDNTAALNWATDAFLYSNGKMELFAGGTASLNSSGSYLQLDQASPNTVDLNINLGGSTFLRMNASGLVSISGDGGVNLAGTGSSAISFSSKFTTAFDMTLGSTLTDGYGQTGLGGYLLSSDGSGRIQWLNSSIARVEIVNAQTGTSYPVVVGDKAGLVTLSNTNPVAVSLPQAGVGGNFTDGWFADFSNINTGLVTITPTTSTIDGLSSLTLSQYQGIRIVSDGANYFTVRGRGITGVTWDQIGNATGNLTLANAGFTTAFNQTSAVNWTWANTTAAANAGYPTPGLGAVNAASVGQGVTSLSININAGDCVVVFTSCSGVSNPAITDNAAGGSNVYTQIGGQLTSWGFENAYVCLNAKAATTITITFAGTTLYTTSAATFVSVGAVGASVQVNNGTVGTATGSVTTTGNQSLVIGGLFCNHTSTLAATSGSAITAISSTTVATSVQTLQVATSGSTGTISASVTPNASCGAIVIELLSGVTNQSSPLLNLSGKYWNATSSVTDNWAIQPVLSGVSNPTSTLTFTHTGSSGVAAVSIPAFTNILSYGNIVEQSTTVATASTTNASPNHQFIANYWTGAASAADTWAISSALVAGTNGASTLGITHAGSTGVSMVTVPTLAITSPANSLILGGTTTSTAYSYFTGNSSNDTSNWIAGNTAQPGLVIQSAGNTGNTAYVQIVLTAATAIQQTSSAVGGVRAVDIGNGIRAIAGVPKLTFSPTSGNCPFIALSISPTINQTGGANGTVTDIMVNSIETAIVGTHNLLDLQAGSAGTTSKLTINNSGIVTNYNAIATVSNGVPSELAVVDLTAQSAAKTATTLYATTATGMYRVSWSATITTAGTTSVLGGTNGFQVLYTSPTDSVVKTTVPGNSVTSAANTTGTAVGGCEVVYAKTGTNIQFTYDYTSTGTTMVYELHIKVEAL